MADVETVTEKHPFEDEVKAENAKRTGKGLRVKYGMTRGKGSMPIKWEAFDDSQPETLPADFEEFSNLTGVKTEKELVEFLIVGFNDSQYTQASDPIAEHVNPAWDKDTQNQFRLVVRNLSKSAELAIEAAVAMIKPGVEKAFLKRQAAAKA